MKLKYVYELKKDIIDFIKSFSVYNVDKGTYYYIPVLFKETGKENRYEVLYSEDFPIEIKKDILISVISKT